jgi:protein-S-isoprenylcysteine O-methyltransferase Ste14
MTGDAVRPNGAEKKRFPLEIRAATRLILTLFCLGIMLFAPARSLRFWQAWVFLLIMSICWIYYCVVLFQRDPKLLERRLRTKETHPAQKWLLRIFGPVLYTGFVLAGLDFHLGWSRTPSGYVTLVMVILGQLGAVLGYWFVFRVMKENSFAGSTIRVEDGQQVVQTGPYALVRHPMYLGMAITALATPLALGSYIALPIFALLIPVLMLRLTYEEKMLHKELPGYSEYCERTRFRLVPGLW